MEEQLDARIIRSWRIRFFAAIVIPLSAGYIHHRRVVSDINLQKISTPWFFRLHIRRDHCRKNQATYGDKN
jgi:hypothetical protein